MREKRLRGEVRAREGRGDARKWPFLSFFHLYLQKNIYTFPLQSRGKFPI
jgi:hypothetical protein